MRPLALITLGLCGCTEPDLSAHPTPPETIFDPERPLPGYRLHLLECPQPGRRDERAFDRFTLPGLPTAASGLVGGGVAAADFDGDGRLDLVITGQLGPQLWLGTADPLLPFAQAPWFEGLTADQAVGAIAVDLEANGRPDLVLTRYGEPNLLLRNWGDHFGPMTPPQMLAHRNRTQAATVADLDGDGDLDLFFGSYGPRPDSSLDPQMAPADPAELYRNDIGLWTDLSSELPQSVHDGYTFASSFVDTDGDGLVEGFVANDFGRVRPSLRLTNRGALQFEAHPDWHPQGEDMGLGVGDLNGDGQPDFLITSASEIYALASDGDRWYDAAGSWALHVDTNDKRQYFGWASDWADLDSDGDLDAIALYGHWSDWLTPTGQQDALWLQVQSDPPVFAEVASDPFWSLADPGPGRGMALADLNGDGWLDVVKRQVGEPTLIDLSRCGFEHRVLIELDAPGPNPRGIGARLELTAGGRTQIRWIAAGGSGLYGGGPAVAHFGLGSHDRIDGLRIQWPDGEIQTLSQLPVDAHITVER